MQILLGAIQNYNDGDYLEAKALCEQALRELGPSDLAHGLLGTVEKALGNQEAAKTHFQLSLKLNPNNPDIHHNFAGLLAESEAKQALRHSEYAISLNPHNPNYQERLGFIHWKLGNLEKALENSKQALFLNPQLIDARITLSAILIAWKQFDEAHGILLGLIENYPDQTEAYINLGRLCRETGQRDAALSACLKAVALRPQWHYAHYNLGCIHQELGNATEARYSYTTALEILPNYPEARFNRALVDLQLGHYSQGWEDYQLRFTASPNKPTLLATPCCDPWCNKSLDELKEILLVGEQGLGDTLQFMRYITPLCKRGIKVRLCAQANLHSLIEASDLDATLLTPNQGRAFHQGCWIPLLSLPRLLGVRPDHPIISKPYIKTSDQLIAKWRTLLASEKKPIIGLHWQGNPATETGLRKGRSMPLETLRPIGMSSSYSLLSLQKGFGEEQLKQCSFRNQFVSCQDIINPIWDFLELAAIIMNCDVIITTDSAVAHLAEGLGKPT